MYKAIWALVLSTLVLGTGDASAKTPDKKPPSQETVCDNETGAAFGLCNSYCEARDCGDPNQHASDRSCEVTRQKFEKLTGRPLPCTLSCPCPGLLKLFADINSGAVPVQQCIVSKTMIVVVTTAGNFAVVDDGPPAECNVNREPPFVDLTETERLVCRVQLRQAVESRGVVCRPPE